MFEDNQMVVGDIQSLLTLWTTHGLSGKSGLDCRNCVKSNKEKRGSTSDDNCDSDKGEEVTFLRNKDQPEFSQRLQLVAHILFKDEKPPPHLYFYVKSNSTCGSSNQQEYLALFDWPFKLLVGGVVYTLCVRGFWGARHYWCKVLKSVGGMVGVWLHNDLENQGNAQWINTVS
jgi:hypothetical protein